MGGVAGAGRHLYPRKCGRGLCLPLAALAAYNQLQMMRQSYIYRQSDWPALRWREEALIDLLAEVRYQQGRLLGRMENLCFALRQSVALETLTAEAVKSSEIEGALLDPEQVRSAVARRMGIPAGGVRAPDRNVAGIVEVVLDATRNYARRLTDEQLFSWHRLLFPDGRNEFDEPINAGAWRNDAKGAMAVVGNGRFGREVVHFEAPPAPVVNAEMQTFLEWCNAPSETDPALKAGLAHLWFVTIHPFDDGNGRMARAIADMLLARADGSPQRFYSMSSQIMRERKDYYLALETAQKGTVDVTEWMRWFLECLGRAIADAQRTVSAAVYKAQFWEQASGHSFNDRQSRLINRLLDGFEGKLTAEKWARIAKCRPDTARRDIAELVDLGILARTRSSARERNAGYHLAGRRR